MVLVGWIKICFSYEFMGIKGNVCGEKRNWRQTGDRETNKKVIALI